MTKLQIRIRDQIQIMELDHESRLQIRISNPDFESGWNVQWTMCNWRELVLSLQDSFFKFHNNNKMAYISFTKTKIKNLTLENIERNCIVVFFSLGIISLFVIHMIT